MNLFTRFRRFWQARQLASQEAGAELDALLGRIETHLGEARTQLAGASGEERRMAALLASEQQESQRMLARARQALRVGQEGLAREAVIRHLRARRLAERCQRIWRQQQEGMARLQVLIEMLEEHRLDLEHRRRQFLLRSQLARTRRTLSETLFGARGRLGLERAEEALLKEELTVDAYQELVGNNSVIDAAILDDSLDAHAVEQALLALRHELELPAPE